jgi:hypothetical protein
MNGVAIDSNLCPECRTQVCERRRAVQLIVTKSPAESPTPIATAQAVEEFVPNVPTPTIEGHTPTAPISSVADQAPAAIKPSIRVHNLTATQQENDEPTEQDHALVEQEAAILVLQEVSYTYRQDLIGERETDSGGSGTNADSETEAYRGFEVSDDYGEGSEDGSASGGYSIPDADDVESF